jgi:hypothetical protein
MLIVLHLGMPAVVSVFFFWQPDFAPDKTIVEIETNTNVRQCVPEMDMFMSPSLCAGQTGEV